ncbi:flagellar assembly protein FliH [Variovorax saccharolyticus]|uniref:flagellar assembly protein FliH n=1 Tax=Variovorax saccharolyticus TaxID=3053516 RepID=UPI00257571AB|nr:flagellar assembly protein FliH [Variovorax sp. J22R187]MDM0021302.1 flagellar assembly protein FliH [Variovorax sp. J22R187]
MATAYAPPVRSTASATPGKPVLSAWQRWEMDTLDAPVNRAPASAGRGMPPPAAEAPPSVALLHAAELVSLRREARTAGEAEGRREGKAKGHAEGYAQGRTEGLAAGLAAASVHAEQLRALAASLPAALRRADSELADAVLTLALDVARQVVHRTLRAEPEWVLPLVQDLLHAEPALQGEPRLLLHPDDVALVKNSLGNELEAAGWQLRPDETLGRGSCRVQSATGEMDASLETRWKSVTAALHRDADAQEV